MSSAVSPAPITTTARPSRSPKTWWASAAAAEATDVGLSAIAVSARTFFPAYSAWRKRRSSTLPVAPGLVRGAHLSEDLAFTRNHRVQARRDAERVQRRRLAVQPVEHRADVRPRRARASAPRRRCSATPLLDTGEVELGAVAGRQADGLAARLRPAGGRARRRPPVERHALAHLDRRVMVRGADEDDAHAKWVGGQAEAHGEDERESGQDEVRDAPPAPPEARSGASSRTAYTAQASSVAAISASNGAAPVDEPGEADADRRPSAPAARHAIVRVASSSSASERRGGHAAGCRPRGASADAPARGTGRPARPRA